MGASDVVGVDGEFQLAHEAALKGEDFLDVPEERFDLSGRKHARVLAAFEEESLRTTTHAEVKIIN